MLAAIEQVGQWGRNECCRKDQEDRRSVAGATGLSIHLQLYRVSCHRCRGRRWSRRRQYGGERDQQCGQGRRSGRLGAHPGRQP